MTHLMIDLETWGLTPGSHLRSIGAVEFDPRRGSLGAKFYVNIASHPTFGLTVDEQTRKWWADQSEEARKVLETKQCILPVALRRFLTFFNDLSPSPADIRVWANGPSFDLTLLEAAFRAAEFGVPWHYKAPRDCRTIFELAGMQGGPDYGTFHNALDDAISQALGVMEAYHLLRIPA